MMAAPGSSHCWSQGPYAIVINQGAKSTVITVERKGDPPFAVELMVCDKFVGEDIRHGPEAPLEARVIDRAPGLEKCHGEEGEGET
jgi:hypothetical protein